MLLLDYICNWLYEPSGWVTTEFCGPIANGYDAIFLEHAGNDAVCFDLSQGESFLFVIKELGLPLEANP